MDTNSKTLAQYRYGKYSKFIEIFFTNSYLTFPELFWSVSNLMINIYVISVLGKYSFISELITTFIVAAIYKFIYLNNIPVFNNDKYQLFKFKIFISGILFFLVVFSGLIAFKILNLKLVSLPNNSLSVYLLIANGLYCLLGGLTYGIFEKQINILIYK